jgi:hypothetical protein
MNLEAAEEYFNKSLELLSKGDPAVPQNSAQLMKFNALSGLSKIKTSTHLSSFLFVLTQLSANGKQSEALEMIEECLKVSKENNWKVQEAHCLAEKV